MFRRNGWPAAVIACLLVTASGGVSQLPPVNQSPQIGPQQIGPQPPAGMAGCSADAPTCADVAPSIISNALGPSPLEENLRVLTDGIGGRVTGSPAAAQAVAWGVEAFRRAGVNEVHTEKFTVAVKWSEGHTHLDILGSVSFPVRLVSTGWSPATPAAGIEADIVDVGTGSENEFKRAAGATKGSIVLVHSKMLVTLEDLFEEYFNGPSIVERAKQSGAQAILWMSSRPYLLLYRHTLSVNGELEPLPQAIVAREDAQRIARTVAARVRLRARLVMPNQIGGPFESENVVAEIRGREKPGEFVLLGAHLDSWDLGTGALDNGCNAAMVIEVARAIHAAGTRPLRSIRFVLFTGEEQGMLGSWAYARAHRSELDRADAVVVYDDGIGRVTGYELGGRKDIESALRQAMKPAESLDANKDTYDAETGTDHFDFLLEGVPTLVANQEPANYMMNYHAASDTFDKVNISQLKKHAALAAVTVYGIADLRERLGKRQSRAEVEHLMKETGLDKQMQAMGMWAMWEKGERGRQP